ncbi:MAG: hypothetical protein ACTHKF_00730 [Candidatus Nitrosocosmicus sp.]
MLIFSLPFCLLLPNDKYHIKLDEGDIVTLQLTKIIPKFFDERLPFRGLLKGELETVSQLKIWNPKTGPGGWIDKNQLKEIKDMQIVLEYETIDGQKTSPEYASFAIDRDVNWDEDLQQIALNEKTNRDIDFGNEIHELNDNDISNEYKKARRLYLNCEVIKDRSGRCRYTRIIYESSKDLPEKEEFERAIEAINLLISQYRLWTGSSWITKVSRREIFFYKTFKDLTSPHGWNERGYGPISPDYDKPTVKRLKDFLLDNKTHRTLSNMVFLHLRLDAQNAFDETNYHLSVIYIITALESIVKVLLSYYYDENQMKDIERKFISRLISEDLVNIFHNNQLDIYLKNIQDALKIRNKIIHEADISIGKEQSGKILKDVSNFISFLSNNLLSKINPNL